MPQSIFPGVKNALIALISLGLAACTTATPATSGTDGPATGWQSEFYRDHPLVGKIWDARSKTMISRSDLEQRLVDLPFILLGERHDNPDHHTLQAEVISALTNRGRHPAIVMEMLDDRQAEPLAEWRAAAPADASSLGPAVEWEKTGWPEWSAYQAIAQAALDANLPILTANMDRDSVRALVRQGLDSFDLERRKDLRLDQPLPPAVTDVQTDAVVDGHCGMMPRTHAGGMVRVQTTRDAIMARALDIGARMPGTDGAVLIAGSGHARADVGVPFQMRRLGIDGDHVVIAFTEVSDADTDPAAYVRDFENLPFDVLWFTPVADTADPCAGMAEHFKTPKAGEK